eukprot:1161129-Pelagomonas_calceolata.AAC.9
MALARQGASALASGNSIHARPVFHTSLLKQIGSYEACTKHQLPWDRLGINSMNRKRPQDKTGRETEKTVHNLTQSTSSTQAHLLCSQAARGP